MTMQIKGLQIAGLPAIAIRNMFRAVHSLLDVRFIAERCKVSTGKAKEVIKTLANDGYIEFSERSGNVDYYELTEKGETLARASAITKMPRSRGDQIIAGLLKRVEEVNANPDYMYCIRAVIVYGSYVRCETHLSDVDIAVDLDGKWDPGSTTNEEFLALANKRVDAARAKGRAFPAFIDTLDWPRKEVMLHLKARTRGLSLHEMHDFIMMKKDQNFAYRVLLGDARRVAEQLGQASNSS